MKRTQKFARFCAFATQFRAKEFALKTLVVTVDPVIKFAKIELSSNGLNLFNAYINVSTLGEDNFGKSLLYDQEVMEELNPQTSYTRLDM